MGYLFQKDNKKGIYGTPEHIAKQMEAIDVLTGNGHWPNKVKTTMLSLCKKEISSEELLRKVLNNEI